MQKNNATITHRQMLTEHVIEFSLSTESQLTIFPGQRILLYLEDKQGSFQRSYSIVDYSTQEETSHLTFVVKLSNDGRGSNVLKKVNTGDTIAIGGVFGTFMLQDTQLPKVFIGTGIGILPLICMARHCMTQKWLFFCVSHKKELFYEQKIKQIPGLRSAVYITKEQVSGYPSGEIDFLYHDFDPNTEFYLSGEVGALDNIVNKLTILGYKRIYKEFL